MANQEEKSLFDVFGKGPLGEFRGSPQDEERILRALVEANMTDPGKGLEYSLAEMQAGSMHAVTGLQNDIAQAVHNQFAERYQVYTRNRERNRVRTPIERVTGREAYSFNEFFEVNRAAYHDVMGSPLDLSMIQATKVGDRTLGEMYPQAFAGQTVGDAMRWLSMSAIGSIVGAAKGLGDTFGEANILDTIQTGFAGAFARIHQYDQGSYQSSQFVKFFGSQAAFASQRARSAERDLMENTLPVSALTGGGISVEDFTKGVPVSNVGNFSSRPISPGGSFEDAIVNAQLEQEGAWGQYANFNVQSRQYTAGNVPVQEAASLRLWGVEPGTPAHEAGWRNGTLVQGLQAILKEPKYRPLLYDAADYAEAGGTDLSFLTQGGKQLSMESVYNPALTSVSPEYYPGPNTREIRENWMTRFADMVDPDARPNVLQQTPGGYQKMNFQRGAPISFPTDLWTIKEEMSTGLYTDASGNTRPAPVFDRYQKGITRAGITLTPETIRTFGREVYGPNIQNWRAWRGVYSDAEAWATERTIREGRRLNQQGRGQGFEYDIFKGQMVEQYIEQVNASRPHAPAPMPGTAAYIDWQNGERLVGAIRQISKTMYGAAPSLDYGQSTIDAFDAIEAESDDPVRPDIYLKQGRRETARRIASKGTDTFFPYDYEGPTDELPDLTGKKAVVVSGQEYVGKERMNRLRQIARERLETLRPSEIYATPEAGWSEAVRMEAQKLNIPLREMSRNYALAYKGEDSYLLANIEENTDPNAPSAVSLAAEALKEGRIVQDVSRAFHGLPGQAAWSFSRQANRAVFAPDPEFDGSIYNADPSTPEYLEAQQVGGRSAIGPLGTPPENAVPRSVVAEGMEAVNRPDPGTKMIDPAIGYRAVADGLVSDPEDTSAAAEAASDITARAVESRAFRQARGVVGLNNVPARLGYQAGNLGWTSDKVKLPALHTAEEAEEANAVYAALHKNMGTPEMRRENLREMIYGNNGLLRRGDAGKSLAAKALYTGRDMQGFADSFNAAVESLGLGKGYLYTPNSVGNVQLFNNMERLRLDNPNAYNTLSYLFPTEEESYQYAENMMRYLAEHPEKAPFQRDRVTGRDVKAKRQSEGDSHVTDLALEGRGVHKWSKNEQREQRRGRLGVDPLSGELPNLENTPVPARVEQRGGGGAGAKRRALNEAMGPQEGGVIYYPEWNEGGENDTGARIGRQTGYFAANDYQEGRNYFNYIFDADAPQELIDRVWGATRSSFEGMGLELADYETVNDPDLPAGFQKIGGYVSEGGVSNVRNANGGSAGGPPEEPPFDPALTAEPPSGNGNGNGNNNRGRRNRPQPTSDPAQWPQPQEGYSLSYTQGGKTKTAVAVPDGEGYRWALDSGNGPLEFLEKDPGYGTVRNAQGEVIAKVSAADAHTYAARQRYAQHGATERGAAANGAVHDPAQFPAPQKDYHLTWQNSGYGKTLHAFGYEDPQTGEAYWGFPSESSPVRLGSNAPGYGTVRDPSGKVVADVSYDEHMAWKFEQSKQAQTTRDAEARQTTPRPARSGEGNDLAGLAPAKHEEYIQNASVRITGATSGYGEFARALGGNFAQDQLRRDLAGKVVGNDDRSMRTWYEGARDDLTQKSLEAWEYMGQNGRDMSPADVANELAARFGVEADDPAIRKAQEVVLNQIERRGTWSEGGRLKRGMGGVYDEVIPGTPLPQRMANMWVDETVARLEGKLSPETFLRAHEKSPLMGTLASAPSLNRNGDPNGKYYWMEEEGLEPGPNGEISLTTAGQRQLNQAMGWGQRAFGQAISTPLPQTPNEAHATLTSRMNKELSKYAEDFVDELVKAGKMDKVDAQAAASKIKKLASAVVDQIADTARESIGDALGDVEPAAANEIKYNAAGGKGAMSANKARELYNRYESVRQAVGSNNLEEILNSRSPFLVQAEGASYDIGGAAINDQRNAEYAERRAKGRQPGGLWGATGGGLLYGMYLIGREWQMAVGQSMQQAEQYGNYVSALGGAALPEGMNATSTDAGFAARQQLGQQYLGRGAYQVFGGLMDLPYLMSGYGDAPARMAATTGLGIGIAGAGVIGAGMLGISALGPIGLAAGGAVALGGLAMEGYNFLTPGEENDVTFSSIGRTIEGFAITERARLTRNWEKFQQTGDFGALFDKGYQDLELTQQEKDVLGYQGTPEPVQKVLDTAAHVQTVSGEDQGSVVQGINLLTRYGLDYEQSIEGLSDRAVREGMSSAQLGGEGVQYALQQGYLPQTNAFQKAFDEYTNLGPQGRTLADFTSQRQAALGSQLQALMPGDAAFYGRGVALVKNYGLKTQAQVGALSSTISGMQQMGADLTPQHYNQLAESFMGQSPYVSGVIGGMAQTGMMAGMSQEQAVGLVQGLSNVGMSSQDAFVYDRIASGDLQALSYQAWQTGNMGNVFYDQAGRSIMQYQGARAVGVYNQWASRVGLQGGLSTGQFLGTGNQEIISAFDSGGMAGLQKLGNQISYEASMASAGIQMRGIALQEQYLWGGGSWDNPDSHSAWGIEDRQRALQHSSQMAEYASQWQRMAMNNRFAIQREDMQWQRMNVTNAYNRWQMDFNYSNSLQQREWAREDWDYQDTNRSLQFGWQMEDVNEAIRFSSGRERRQLIKQRERMGVTQSLENEQIDTQRKRQEETWAKEDERFQKTKQYQEQLMDLDTRGFLMNKSQREELYKLDQSDFQRRMDDYLAQKELQDELIELQRKHQYDQLQLQKEAAGVQAAAAQKQKELNEAMIEGQKKWEEMTGRVEQMNKYDRAFALTTALSTLAKDLDKVNPAAVQAIIHLIGALKGSGSASISTTTSYSSGGNSGSGFREQYEDDMPK